MTLQARAWIPAAFVSAMARDCDGRLEGIVGMVLLSGAEEVGSVGGLVVQPAASEGADGGLKRQSGPRRKRQVYPARRCGDANEDHGPRALAAGTSNRSAVCQPARPIRGGNPLRANTGNVRSGQDVGDHEASNRAVPGASLAPVVM
jgi:hypothetical protein